MSKKKKKNKKNKFAKIYRNAFLSLTVLLVGTFSLLKSGEINYYSVVNTMSKLIPAMIILGWLGYKIGSILDHPKLDKAAEFRNLIMDELSDLDKKIDLSQFDTEFPDFAEINAKLISENQAAEPQIEITEDKIE